MLGVYEEVDFKGVVEVRMIRGQSNNLGQGVLKTVKEMTVIYDKVHHLLEFRNVTWSITKDKSSQQKVNIHIIILSTVICKHCTSHNLYLITPL